MLPKKRKPLSPGLQALAAAAYLHAEPMAREFECRYPRLGVDWSGEIAVRICSLISTYNAGLSALETWAGNQARYACKDAIKAVLGRQRRHPRPGVISLDADRFGHRAESPYGNPCRLSQLVAAPPGPAPCEEADALHLLRGLRPLERAVVCDSIVAGRPLKEIGREYGLCEARISQVRSEALEFLRHARRDAV